MDRVILSILLGAAVLWIIFLLCANRKLKVQLRKETFPERPEKRGFTYLAIGNSITKHGKCAYWWDDRRGMASSEPEKDYVHRVAAHLKKIHGTVDFSTFNFFVWEVQAKDRAETLSLLEKPFTIPPDLVTVQLGENVRDATTLTEDYTELFRWIREHAPKAKVIVVGDFWSEEKNQCRKEAAEKCTCAFADLSELMGKKEYQCPVGTLVKDDQGMDHKVEHAGVAAHPGDAGMAVIAEKIIQQL